MIYLVIVLLVLTIYAFISRHRVNTKVDQENQQLLIQNKELKEKNDKLYSTNTALYKEEESLHQSCNLLTNNIEIKQGELQRLYSATEAAAAAQEDLTNKAFSSYCDVLEAKYCQIDQEFNDKKQYLTSSIEQEQKKLNEIKATRAAAQQALLKEQEVKENKDNYRLIPSSSDLEDIKELERVRRVLHKPRILSMLIWQTYWQPLAKTKFPIILHNKTCCGIYKITNLQTNECYIGQSLDIDKRWKDHCKCGLGIDTPVGNKLYKAINDYGLENFTFELLAECTKEELDSKEKYFIELYQAKEYGYNSTGGNK